MTPGAAAKTLSEEGLAEMRRRTVFRHACERSAAGAVEHFRGLPAHHQWVTKDLGRGSITFSAIILQLTGGLTAQALTNICVAQGVSSPGRVTQFVKRTQAAGELTVEPGPGFWTRRPMRLGPAFLDAARSRLEIDIESALLLAPEQGAIRAVLADDDGYLSFAVALGTIVSSRRNLFALARQPPLNIFLNREAGIHMLYELVGAQAPQRERLLEEATISRNALAQRYGVSRAHINKLLADSGHSRADGERVVFTPELSDRLERHMALVFCLTNTVSQCLLDGWRLGAPRPERSPSAVVGALDGLSPTAEV